MMINSVKTAIERYNMLDGVTEVTVALSGGADSVALLVALNILKEEYEFNLSAAHLNHMLRGVEADGDEAFSKDLCKSLGIPFVAERIDVKNVSAMTGDSIELAARNVRYEFLKKVSKGVIATAHTASDNIETVLFNMARGTGIDGLCGIPPKRGRIIRPLILVTRSEVEDFLSEKGYVFKTDSTNNDDLYSRNKIRHSAVPTLQSVNSAAVKNVSALSEGLRTDADFLKNSAKNSLEYCLSHNGLRVDGLLSLHTAVSSRVIAMQFENVSGIILERKHILSVLKMLETGDKRVSLKGDYEAVNYKGLLKFKKAKTKVQDYCIEVSELPFCQNGVTIKKISAEELKKFPKVNSLLLNNAVDYDRICGRLVLRNRKFGDKITLKGRKITKTFKKLFNENGIDCEVREKIPVLADDNGVVWLGNFGVDNRVAVTDETKNILIVEI